MAIINHDRRIVENKLLEDVFGAYLLDNARFEGYFDIPIIEQSDYIQIPSNLVPYSKLTSVEYDDYTYCHFYEKDYIFDGRYGIWNAFIQNKQFRRGFNLNKMNNVYGIICPDFSTYYDMPRVMQIWNVYRSRVVGYFLSRLGYRAIPNVRWTDEKSYEYSFLGLQKNSVIAVSTLGCLRANMDSQFFYSGLVELIVKIQPSCIILYGSLTAEVKAVFDKHRQRYVFFPSRISVVMGNKNGNEI